MEKLKSELVFKMKKAAVLTVSVILFIISLASTTFSSEFNNRIKEIKIQGNRYFKLNELYYCMKLKPGSIYSNKLLERSTEEILSLYEDNGFPYCQIDFGDFNYSISPDDLSKWFSFNLKIIEGPRVKIRKTEFVGNNDTKVKVLNRIIDIDSTEFFSQKRLESGISRLRRSSFIKNVQKAELVPEADPAWAALRIEVEENKQNSFLGVLGYVPSAHNKNGYFSGKLNFIFDNIFGTGRKTEIAWSKKDPYSFDLVFTFREPYLFNLPLGWDLYLRQIDYDSSYSKLELNTYFGYSPLEKFSFGFTSGWERVMVNERLKSILPSSRKYKMGIKLSLDLLDYPANPQKGLFYQSSIIYGRKINLLSPETETGRAITYETRFQLDLDNFIPIHNNQVLALSAHWWSILSSEKKIYVTDLFYLGGLNSLRGYREEEFSGDRILWTNIEYRFLLSSGSRAFIFWDFGYYGKEAENPLTQTVRKVTGRKSGLGLGLKVDTRLGRYEVDYALGEEDNFSSGKIHFGISNRF
ncbi:MAG: BamA/TamA family outer membrane protein [candidate division Zixibacteria bacterium]|nr:BamA/TamA family outer membrane protein [candidate division Zixibacteria bacterium]